MKVSEQIAIIKAYEDGKSIEKKRCDETKWEILEYVEDYPFDFVLNDYRIKQVPKYRPYKSVDEAFNDAKKHGFWMQNVDRMYLRFIDCFHINKNSDIFICDYCVDDILDMFVWADDGSPCGVKIN